MSRRPPLRSVLRVSRRSVLRGLGALVLLAALPGTSAGQDVSVPIGLQVKLLAKVAAYERNMESRAWSKVRVLVLVASGDASSERTAQRVVSALEREPKIAGLEHLRARRDYGGAKQLIKAVSDE